MIQSEESIKRYYESIKDKYPDLTLEQVEQICRLPFSFVKEKMKDENLPEVRLKYLGTFSVRFKNIRNLLEKTKLIFNLGKLSEEKFIRYTTSLTNLQQRYKDEGRDK